MLEFFDFVGCFYYMSNVVCFVIVCFVVCSCYMSNVVCFCGLFLLYETMSNVVLFWKLD